MKGTIKWFNVKKGYGFIHGEDGKDYFVHYTGIDKGRHYTGLEEEDEVTFELEDTPKGGCKAVKVNLTKPVKISKKASSDTTAENSEPAE